MRKIYFLKTTSFKDLKKNFGLSGSFKWKLNDITFIDGKRVNRLTLKEEENVFQHKKWRCVSECQTQMCFGTWNLKDDPQNFENWTWQTAAFVRCYTKPTALSVSAGLSWTFSHVWVGVWGGVLGSEGLLGGGQSEKNRPIKNTVSLGGQESIYKHFGEN